MNDKFLKDAILSTIAEIEGDVENINIEEDKKFDSKHKNRDQNSQTTESDFKSISFSTASSSSSSSSSSSATNSFNKSSNSKNNLDEEEFLSNILQKLTLLFEGLKSDKLTKREEKNELIIKYLQVLQILIEERVQKIK